MVSKLLVIIVSFTTICSAQYQSRNGVIRGTSGQLSTSYGIIEDGDSLTTSPTVPLSYPSDVAASIGRFNNVTNDAVSGYTTTDIVNHLAPVVLPQLTTFGSRGKIYTLLIGTNDAFSGYSTIVGTICPAIVGAGANMILLTGLPWNNESTEPARLAYNTNIRNGAMGAGGNCYYTVADIASDPRLQNHLDTTYYSDGTHPTAAGAAVIAEYVLAAVQVLGVQ